MKSQVTLFWLSQPAETALSARALKIAIAAEAIQAVADQMALDELLADLAFIDCGQPDA